MRKEMQEELKKDVESGMIWGLRLVKTPVEAIKNNTCAMMFEESRPISGFDEKCFYLATRYKDRHYLPGTYDGKNYVLPDYSIPTDFYTEAEAYYSAFDYYDGNILRSTTEITAAVDPKDIIQITEYEVIRSY